MHEMSIVQALIASCEEHARRHSATTIHKVEVKIGVMSGVEPELLATCFETFKEGTICDGAKLVVIVQEVVVLCNDCQLRSTLTERLFRCPECKGSNLEIIDGEEMYLMSLEME